MSKILFPSLALVCALTLAACGEDAPATSESARSDSSEPPTAGPTDSTTTSPVRDAEFAVVEKVRQANADDPRIVFTRAVTAAVANRRTMLIDCSLKPADARKNCESAAQEVYQAARADATANLKAATEGQTDTVEASDATASSGE